MSSLFRTNTSRNRNTNKEEVNCQIRIKVIELVKKLQIYIITELNLDLEHQSQTFELSNKATRYERRIS